MSTTTKPAMQYVLKITGSCNGYYLTVAGSSLHAHGSIARRMDGSTGVTWDGTYLPDASDRPAIEAVIAAVMASGVELVITIGDHPRPQDVSPAWRSNRGLTLTTEMDRDDTDF